MATRPAPNVSRPRMRRVLHPAAKAIRTVLGRGSVLEQRIRRTLRIDPELTRGPGYLEWRKPRAALVRSTSDPEPTTGIYLRGACDLPSLFALVPRLRPELKGTVAIASNAREISATRADVLLQTLDDLPVEATEEVRKRLRLPHDYFEPTVFSPTFTLPGLEYLGEFPKTVVVLSLAPNVIRTLYRHREHGFLVDPGGMWLNQDLNLPRQNPEQVAWFRDTFEPAGRLGLEQFGDLFSRLVQVVRERSRADHILVFNVLTVEPGDRIHSYQLRNRPEVLRRREFCLALVDLSRALGFQIVDIDRVLKRHGVDRQVDFAHFPAELATPISADVFAMLRSIDVV